MGHTRRATLALLLLAAAACEATPPDDGTTGGGKTDDGDEQTDAAPAPTDAGPAPLNLGPLPTTTYWPAVPLHGTGPKGGTVLVQSDAAGSLTAPIDGGGAFCLDVPLTRNATNTIHVTAIDATGEFSEELVREVRHQGAPPPPPPGEDSRNVARRGAVSWGLDADDRMERVADGDWDTMVSLSNDLGDDWVWVELTERALIDKFVVVSADDCRMEHYWLMFSDVAVPGEPNGDNANWTIGDVETDWTATQIRFESAVVARHVAVNFRSQDCDSSWFGVGPGRHKLAELQAWNLPEAPPPPQQAPSCAGGGP